MPVAHSSMSAANTQRDSQKKLNKVKNGCMQEKRGKSTKESNMPELQARDNALTALNRGLNP